MRIAFFSAAPGTPALLRGGPAAAGGAEKQICALARGLARDGHEVSLLHGTSARGSIGEEEVLHGVRCTAVGTSVRGPGDAVQLYGVLRRLRPEALYARLPHDLLVVLATYARLHRPARFLYAVAYDPYCRPWGTALRHGWFHDTAYAGALRLSDRILVQHAGQQRALSPGLRTRAVQVPNAVAEVAEAPRPLTACTADVAWIAHLRAEKQVELFLDLVATLPRLRFVMAGAPSPDLDERRAVERRIAALPNLVHHGLVDPRSARALIRGSRVLVNTSLHEGFPNTMLEAWSAGVPVVSLSVDPDEVISREGLGLVSGTRPGLRRDLLRLVEDEPRNLALGRRGIAYVQRRHALPAVLARLESELAPALPRPAVPA